jgi:DNA-directed RNA polymerase specialized sigma24 family protein
MNASDAEMTSQPVPPAVEADPSRRFFLEPATPAQRQYEAIRAVIIEGLPQKEVAQRFGYTHDSLRQLLSQFRAACRAGESPPFSPHRVLAAVGVP